jgi:hypothetical protein
MSKKFVSPKANEHKAHKVLIAAGPLKMFL